MGRMVLLRGVKKVFIGAVGLATVLVLFSPAVSAEPIGISPDNPHFFQYKGKPFRMVGTYTHPILVRVPWGKVTTPFDYEGFFDTLAENRINAARVWLFWNGKCYERTGPGLARDGQPKYDLNRFNPDYFRRLEAMTRYAEKKGIILELILFDGWITKKEDLYSKYHAYAEGNNVNGVCLTRQQFGIYPNAASRYQDAFIRRVVDTINARDNWFFETKNEGGMFREDWVRHLIGVVREYEAGKAKHHLMAHEPHWGGYDPFTHKDVDVYSRIVWYTTTPHREVHEKLLAAYGNACAMPCFYDSDGGSSTAPQRQDQLRKNAWAAVIAGGHVQIIYSQGDIPALRTSLRHLMTFMDAVDWVRMKPRDDLVDRGYCLARPDEYVVYLPDGGSVQVSLTEGRKSLRARWFNPRTGEYTTGPEIKRRSKMSFKAPFPGDAVLHVFFHAPSFPAFAGMTEGRDKGTLS